MRFKDKSQPRLDLLRQSEASSFVISICARNITKAFLTQMHNSTVLKPLAALSCIFIASAGLAQGPLRGTLTMGFGDVAAIKQKAEAGDAGAQVALGDSLASRFHSTEALDWYRKAAVQENVQGEYHVGQMLLFGAPGIPNQLTVKPNPTEGLRWTFMAATNFYPHACWNMGRAFRQGLGTDTNLIEAYAWLKLFSETTAGSVVGRVEMNEIALKLNGDALRQAQELAAQFKAGNWQLPVAREIPEGDPRLKLNGVTLGKTPLAVINGKSLAEGESTRIPLKPAALNIKCLKIRSDSVLISIEGENTPRLLRLE